jgi:hypothetical protein
MTPKTSNPKWRREGTGFHLRETIHWFRTDLKSPPVDEQILGRFNDDYISACILDEYGNWWLYPVEGVPMLTPPMIWAKWPEGPTTCEGEE